MNTSFDTFRKYSLECSSFMRTKCYSLFRSSYIKGWKFISGSVSKDGICIAEFVAPTSIKGKRYYIKIEEADKNIRCACTII